MKKKIILRADGNAIIGLGHVFRLLALASMIKDDYDCVLAIAAPDEFIKQQIKITGITYVELPTVKYKLPDKRLKGEEIPFDLDLILKGNEIVVTDGYWFGTQYQVAVKKKRCKLICIDDLAEWLFYADAIINHNPGFNISNYKVQSYTNIFHGLEYLLIRRIFFDTPISKKNTDIPQVLISLGGSDYHGITYKICKEVLSLKKPEINLHILTSSLFTPQLLGNLEVLEKQNPSKFTLYQNLQVTSLLQTIDKCTHAITSSSGILLECYARKINLACGYYAQNQISLYNYFTEKLNSVGLKDFSDFSPLPDFIFSETENKSYVINSVHNINKIFRNL